MKYSKLINLVREITRFVMAINGLIKAIIVLVSMVFNYSLKRSYIVALDSKI
jgi:hypothetical protein